MKVFNTVIAMVAAVLLTACVASVPLQPAQIGSLARESAPSDVDRILDKATVVAKTEFSANEKSYVARHFSLQTGTRQEMFVVCTPACMPIFTTVPVTAEYVVVQRLPSMELLAWGTLEELSKDSDNTVSAIMPIVKARFDETKKKP